MQPVLLSPLLFGQLRQCGAIVSLRKYLTKKKRKKEKKEKKKKKEKKRKHRPIFLKSENNSSIVDGLLR